MDTGKTYRMGEFLKANKDKSIISITCRRILARNQTNKLNDFEIEIKCYIDNKFYHDTLTSKYDNSS